MKRREVMVLALRVAADMLRGEERAGGRNLNPPLPDDDAVDKYRAAMGELAGIMEKQAAEEQVKIDRKRNGGSR